MKPARVLQLINSLEIGGAENFVVSLVRNLDRSRYESAVCAFATDGPLRRTVEGLGVPIYVIRPRGVAGMLKSTIQVLRDYRPDLVHAHSLAPGFYGALAGTLCRVPVLTTRHGRPEESADRSLFRFLSNHLTDRFVAVSDEVRRLLIEVSRIPEGKICTIANGIDTRRFDGERNVSLRHELGIEDGAFLFGTVGRLSRTKAQHIMLDALRRLREMGLDAQMVLAGEGAERPRLEQCIQDFGLQGIAVLLGSRADIPALLHAMDAFVLSSVDEGLPLALLEAMAAGLPCIATRVGGIPEVICDGTNGILVAPGNATALAAAMHRVVADPELRLRMGRAAAQTVRSRFSIQAMLEAYLERYDDLVYRRRAPRPIRLASPGGISRRAAAVMHLVFDKKVPRPTLVLESDDWGQTAAPDRETYNALLRAGIVAPDNRWASDALETPEDLSALGETLRGFPDAEGRPPPITANFILANPDFARITEGGVPFVPADAPDNNPISRKLRTAWAEAAKEGWLCPEYHGMRHLASEALGRLWHEGDPQVKPFVDAGMRPPSLTSAAGRRLLSEYVRSTDDGTLLPRDPIEQRRLVREGVAVFQRLFGRPPLSTVPPHYLWTEDTERIFAEVGICSIQSANRSYVLRRSSGFLQVRRMALGRRSPAGLTYLTRNVRFEPALYDDTAEDAFRQIKKAFDSGRPAIISCHRINFSGAIMPERRDRTLRELGHLLNKVRTAYPGVAFLTSSELAARLAGAPAAGLTTALRRFF